MLRAVLFDFGDTLIDFEPMDTRGVFRAAARQTYRRLKDAGHRPPPFRRFFTAQYRAIRWAYLRSKLAGKEFNSLDLLRQFHQRHALPSDDRTLRELAWLWYEPITRRCAPDAGAQDVLRWLSESGLKLAIVSNTFIPGSVLDRHLEQAGLLEFFPVRVYSSEVRYRKPSREIFEIALQQLQVRGRDALFVGDLLKTDIIGARRAGMRTVLKQPWGRSGPHRVAHYTIRRLSELQPIVEGLLQPGGREEALRTVGSD